MNIVKFENKIVIHEHDIFYRYVYLTSFTQREKVCSSLEMYVGNIKT